MAKKQTPPKPEGHTITVKYQRLPNGGFTFDGTECSEQDAPPEDVYAIMEMAASVQKFKVASLFGARRRQLEAQRRMMQAMASVGGAPHA